MTPFSPRGGHAACLGRRIRLALLAAPLLLAFAVAVLPWGAPASPALASASPGLAAPSPGHSPARSQRPLSSGVGHEVRHDPAAVGDCRVEVDQRAAPDPVVRGSALNLTLTVRAACE